MRATSLLASFSPRNFGTRSLMSENSEVAYSNVSKQMQNDEHMDTQKTKKWRLRQSDRQPERRLLLIGIKILSNRGTENKPSHSIPFQKYWVWQVQLNDPKVFVQSAPLLVQLLLTKAHSSISENNSKRSGGMDNIKRLHELLNIFYFQISNFVAVYNLGSTRHSNYKINGTWTSMQKFKKRTHI